ncbi:MAG: hypothetical protein CVV47_02865 [Spirochaetae bacterium HGW-Spirochaetae-3]|jgi:acetyl esterase/lipase|nr:MAG: hypothetical protein CVV47_02865 [Spirochaetae bacterium HGW-Spirochaetae-3]
MIITTPPFIRSSPFRRAFTLFLLAFLCGSSAPDLFAAPGDIVSLDFEKRMTPSDVDAFIEKLFVGYEAPKAKYPVDVYWLKFESLYPDGEKAVATAQVFMPSFEPGDVAVRPLYAFGPGSTGVIDACRPSREHLSRLHWGYYRAHTLAHAGQGAIGVMPDYLGFGDPDRDQYYMVAKAEASAMLDSIRAVKTIVVRGGFGGVSDTRNYVAGFSQGGHAAFAAADCLKSYAPELRLDGVIGYGPSADLIALFKEFPDVAPMVLYTFRNLYGKEAVDPDLALAKVFAPSLDYDITRQCVGGMQSYYPIDPKRLFNAEFSKALLGGTLQKAYPGIFKALTDNSTGLAGHGVPVLICQGTDDIVVHGPTQAAFVKALEEAGSTVEYNIYKGVRHDTRQASFEDVQAWMNRPADTGSDR